MAAAPRRMQVKNGATQNCHLSRVDNLLPTYEDLLQNSLSERSNTALSELGASLARGPYLLGS